ncbi:MAG: sigma-70 family RNA polymerase sigma factor [Planctomycetota bacterium]
MRPFEDQEREALRRGAPAAWGRVCAEVAPRLLVLLRCRMDAELSARLDPEDLLQEGLLQLSRSRLDPGPAGLALLAWLREAAAHLLIDGHRRHVEAARRSVRSERGAPAGPGASDEQASPLTTPTRAARRAERAAELARALQRLGVEQRDVLLHRLIEGHSLAETAKLMSRSEGAVSVLQNRALKSLREVYRGPAPTGAP